MSVETKCEATFSASEAVDPRDLASQRQQRRIRLCHHICLGLTTLALLSGITILGTSANALIVYDHTHVSSNFNLPLWPEAFDLRPTVALVVAGVVVAFTNIVSLVFSSVSVLRNQARARTALTFAAPFVGFVVTLVAISFYYVVNASITVDTLESWSCQWGYADMHQQPHFGTLCKQSQTALYLCVILVPVELMAFAVAIMQMGLERQAAGLVLSRKPSS